MEVNKGELLIHILRGAGSADGMCPMGQAALRVYVMLIWHVDMFSGWWLDLVFLGMAGSVEAGDDDLHGCFHVVHGRGLGLFAALDCGGECYCTQRKGRCRNLVL